MAMTWETETPWRFVRMLGPVHWLLARLWSGRADQLLAAGVPEGRQLWLSYHAAQIGTPRARAGLAACVRRVVERAETRTDRRPVRATARPPINRDYVRALTGSLLLLADWLDSQQPVSAHTLAQVRVLLADGTGPLYRLGSGRMATGPSPAGDVRAGEGLLPAFAGGRWSGYQAGG